MRACFAALLAVVLAAPAAAQIDSREGIALQNMILQLRQEIEQLRRLGGGGGGPAPAPAPRPGVPAGQGDLVAQLLSRVGQLEEEVRRQRGRADEAENQNRQLTEALNKLREDLDFRMQQLEGGRGGGAPARPAAPAAPAPAPARQGAAPASPAAPAEAARRTPEQALAAGQAALGRNDYAAAEQAAREVLAVRNSPRAQDGRILLGQALAGRRDHQAAALAFDDAYRSNRTSSRAPEALIGLAGAFAALNARREACDTIAQARSEFPRMAAAQASQAEAIARRANCGR